MKGVILTAGYGTRFLPITKTIPKEMLPLGTRPSIEYVVREYLAAGIRDILFVTSRRKKALEDYFDREVELESTFERQNDRRRLEQIAPPDARFYFIRQRAMGGTGDAVLLAREFVGDDPFVLAFPDDLMLDEPPLARQLIEVYERTGRCVLALEERPAGEDISRYGVVAVSGSGPCPEITGMVEKPPRGEEPSRLISIGRFLLTPELFPVLEEEAQRPRTGELYLTTTLDRLARAGRVVGCIFQGERLDTGEPLGYYQTLVRFLLRDPDLGPRFRRFLEQALG